MWEQIDEERGVNKKVRMLHRLNRVLVPSTNKIDNSTTTNKHVPPVKKRQVILRQDGASLSMHEKLKMIEEVQKETELEHET